MKDQLTNEEDRLRKSKNKDALRLIRMVRSTFALNDWNVENFRCLMMNCLNGGVVQKAQAKEILYYFRMNVGLGVAQNNLEIKPLRKRKRTEPHTKT